MEVGSVATPFEHRAFGEELALCQRYYQECPPLAGQGNGTTFFGSVSFTTAMRAQPSLTMPNNSLNLTDGYAADYASTNASPAWTDYQNSGGRFSTLNHSAVSDGARDRTMMVQTNTTLDCDSEL